MRLFGSDDFQDDDDVGIDDADTQEQEAIAYRFVQVLWDRCEALAHRLARSEMNHPVIFLCDVGDHFGLAIARKVSTPELIRQALNETGSDARPGIISGVEMEEFNSREPTIMGAVRERMSGLIGYFPIVVAAKGGFSVFPCPYKLPEKSKFKLFPEELPQKLEEK
jgi:hypothetical protein